MNGLLGIISVSTTLVSLALSVVDINLFAILFYFDCMVNGILIIMVLNFGNWLVCPCCQKLIDKLINCFENTSTESKLKMTQINMSASM